MREWRVVIRLNGQAHTTYRADDEADAIGAADLWARDGFYDVTAESRQVTEWTADVWERAES